MKFITTQEITDLITETEENMKVTIDLNEHEKQMIRDITGCHIMEYNTVDEEDREHLFTVQEILYKILKEMGEYGVQ